MSDESRDIAAIKEKLVARRAELEEQLSDFSSDRISPDQVQDAGDQALSATMETLKSSLQNTELDEHKRIVRALEKIEDGTYGVCIDCGEDVSDKRLKMYPNASRCLVCQEAFEDKNK